MNTCILKTEKVCKSFVTDGEVNNVIKNLDLEIYKEDFTVIMGSSGSGKSTLLYLLSGMDKITSGDVYLKDKKITRCKENEMAIIRRNYIGFVFQEMNLVPDLTVRENILSPTYKSKFRGKELLARVNEILSDLSITEHQNKFPNQLSGGQKQRAAIGRALVNQPEVVFADEPTGALNSGTGEQVLDTFTKLYENGQSIVMATHDLKAAVRGNKILFIKDGRLDGELHLGEFQKEAEEERISVLYTFLNKRGW